MRGKVRREKKKSIKGRGGEGVIHEGLLTNKNRENKKYEEMFHKKKTEKEK